MGLVKIIRNWQWIILTLIFWAIALRCIPAEFCDLGGDSAQYIILAESLSQGKGLRMANYPGEPLSFYYPPVFPLLLYPIVRFLGRNFYAMHFLITLLGYGCLWLFYLIFKQYDKRTAFFATGLLAANWIFILYCTQYILSDIPYLFFSGVTLFFAQRYIKKADFLNKEGLLLISGLLLAYFTRYIGVTLFFALTLSLLILPEKHKFKKIFFAGGVFVIACASWNAAKNLQPGHTYSHFGQLFLIDPYAPHKGSILAHPLFFITRFMEGADYYYRMLSDIFFLSVPQVKGALKECARGLIFGFIFFGLWRVFRKNKECVLHYYFIFYFLLIIFWPFREGVRFMAPLLPFILFYFLSGAKETLGFIFKRFSLPAVSYLMGIFFLLAILNLRNVTSACAHNHNNLPKPFQNFISMHRWINKNLPQDGIIISRKPTITYFYTGHKAIIYPFSLKPETIWQEVAENKIQYILVDEFSRETYYYLLPFLRAHKGKFVLLRQIGNTGLFAMKK